MLHTLGRSAVAFFQRCLVDVTTCDRVTDSELDMARDDLMWGILVPARDTALIVAGASQGLG